MSAMDNEFTGYVADIDVHDATIVEVAQQSDQLLVTVEAEDRHRFIIEFGGVVAVEANQPEGMVLYSLSELRAAPPTRRFIFTNWDEEDRASLAIVALTIQVRK